MWIQSSMESSTWTSPRLTRNPWLNPAMSRWERDWWGTTSTWSMGPCTGTRETRWTRRGDWDKKWRAKSLRNSKAWTLMDWKPWRKLCKLETTTNNLTWKLLRIRLITQKTLPPSRPMISSQSTRRHRGSRNCQRVSRVWGLRELTSASWKRSLTRREEPERSWNRKWTTWGRWARRLVRSLPA